MVFRPFLSRYYHVLNYEKLAPFPLHARFTWEDEGYKLFIKEILCIMEPRTEPPNYTLIYEMDEFMEVTFFVN